MGMYTQLVLTVNLMKSFEYINVLTGLLKSAPSEYFENIGIPDHPFFKTDRWRIGLTCCSSSLPGATVNELTSNSYNYELTIVTSLKNYDDEIEKFLDWIAPHVENKGFCGFIRYEEDKMPKLIWIENKNVIFMSSF